jgi:hypothetical protein
MRDPPAFVRQLLTDSLSPKLCFRIVERPASDFSLVLQGLVIKCIKLFDCSKLAGPRFDEIESFAGDFTVCEVECNECEVAAS